jgi:signal peptidase II
MTPRQSGVAVAVIGLVLDQAVKLWLLGSYALAEKGRVAVAPFLDLVLVWNYGVSYGLFQQEGEAGRWLLIGIGLAGSALFAWWLWRAEHWLSALSLGLIIGGALSNVIDRLAYGAVADFFLFHIGRFEWYVFNLADAWIVAGVVGLVLAWAVERPEKATES